MRETKEALDWIVAILRKNKIKFEITGGMASRVYGSKRPLADIDIEVSDKYVFRLKELVKKNIVYGPKEYKDKNFDLSLMTLKYKGQIIDICGKDSEKIFDKNKNKWVKEKTDLGKAKKKKVKNLIIPVVSLKSLLKYKKKLARNVDKKDVKELSALQE